MREKHSVLKAQASEARAFAHRRQKEKTLAFRSAELKACSRAAYDVERVNTAVKFSLGNNSAYHLAADKSNEKRRVASESFKSAAAARVFAKEASRIMRDAHHLALRSQAAWKAAVRIFVVRKSQLEKIREIELEEKARIPFQERNMRTPIALQKTQNEVQTLVNDTQNLVNKVVNMSDAARSQANEAVQLASNHGLNIPPTVGRVLEVADCPWCHTTSLDADSIKPDQGLLALYLKNGLQEIKSWTADVNPTMNHTASIRASTRLIMGKVLRSAAYSNANFSSARARARLKYDELKAEQNEVHKLAGEEEKRDLYDVAKDRVHVTEEMLPVKIGENADILADYSMEHEISSAHQKQLDQASVMKLKAETAVAKASAHEEAETIRNRIMQKASKAHMDDNDDMNDLDKLSVVSHLSALRQQVAIALTPEQREASIAAFRKFEDTLVAKLSKDEIHNSSANENKTVHDNKNVMPSAKADGINSTTGVQAISQVSNSCDNCSDAISQLKATLSTQKAKILELEKRQEQNEKQAQANAIAITDSNADENMEQSRTTSEYEDCIDGDCDLLKDVPTTHMIHDSKLDNATGNSTLDDNNSSVCHPVDVFETNSSCPSKVVSISGSKCAGDLAFSDAVSTCKARNMDVCKHAQLENAYSCGFRSSSCGWTRSKVKAAKGNLIERLSDQALEICDISSERVTKAGVFCC